MEVRDVNDNAPRFIFTGNESLYTAEITENIPFSVILDFVATDQDSDVNAQITFSPSSSEFIMTIAQQY